MPARTTRPPLQAGSFVWGPLRLGLGISLRQLSQEARINKATLSLYENGRMSVPAHHFDAVMAAIERLRAATADIPVSAT